MPRQASLGLRKDESGGGMNDPFSLTPQCSHHKFAFRPSTDADFWQIIDISPSAPLSDFCNLDKTNRSSLVLATDDLNTDEYDGR
ncbi:hypothetical protein E4U09_002341 [Claviceps aff. purpurea]|uniref:Uncharacterized protein n=1 Tax=Claviceps aff. purpurea TaxID=1967640 RepID=A0A9P7QIQ7_9HYPO|nr:hypothetical protein E4U09_002341 [Claviceps aff. purpurea]